MTVGRATSTVSVTCWWCVFSAFIVLTPVKRFGTQPTGQRFTIIIDL
jgi:hypothetical protein